MHALPLPLSEDASLQVGCALVLPSVCLFKVVCIHHGFGLVATARELGKVKCKQQWDAMTSTRPVIC